MAASTSGDEGPGAGRLEPVQGRSRRTRDRLLTAARAVLSREGVDGATVAAIAEEAGVAVGTVYRRFPDKEALLRHLEEVFVAGRREYWAGALRRERWAERSLESFYEFFAVEVVRRHREEAGFLRAVATRARAEYEASAAPESGRPWGAVTDLVLGLWGERIRRRPGARAVALTLEMISATAGELVLFRGGAASSAGLTGAVLPRELARASVAYLTGAPEGVARGVA